MHLWESIPIQTTYLVEVVYASVIFHFIPEVFSVSTS